MEGNIVNYKKGTKGVYFYIILIVGFIIYLTDPVQ
jgi:hypothetical protein